MKRVETHSPAYASCSVRSFGLNDYQYIYPVTRYSVLAGSCRNTEKHPCGLHYSSASLPGHLTLSRSTHHEVIIIVERSG
ncbi:hypothetical protein E2C01_102372 [Portunus trituberculatus]|uniref:Uncharacterized protein n=1 Tax=Portunus trituberculatus TaxID=210409 RepID=A0A5B7KIA5_PORTR|nr:hypothetical protein [Portunus trituberculatus]